MKARVVTAAVLSVLPSPLAAVAASSEPLEQRVRRLSAFWHSGALEWNEVAATISMLLALGLLFFACGGLLADLGKRADGDGRDWAIVAAVVLAWSLFVRFFLAEANIFTDGGSGYGRVMRYIEGYGGMASLVKLLPAAWDGFMWRAMLLPRLLASLGPVLLVWVARGLGLGAGPALFGGIMLASLPIHAALSSSDLLVGPMSTVQLAGLALVLAARRRELSDLFAAGVALVAWAMWFRPEGALGVLPVAVACLGFPLRWWRRWDTRAVVAVFAVLVVLRVAALATGRTVGVSGGAGSLSAVDWRALLTSTILVPPWLWLPAPFAVWTLWRRGALGIALAGLIAGLVPVYLRGLYPDAANTHLEAVRYGVPLLAWLALVSAVALDSICSSVAAVFSRGSQRALLALRAVLVVALAIPALAHREYLGRTYGHASSERAIRELLPSIPAGCGLLVPDDRPEVVNIEIHHRYANIAAEWYAAGGERAIEVVPVGDYLDGSVDRQKCWMFLRGPYCYHAAAGRPAIGCTELADRFVLEEVAAISIEFRHHRLVTGPDVRRAPWYMGEMPIILYRVAGPRRTD